MLAIESKEKSYADSKRSNVEFQAGEEVLLRVPLTKDVIIFNIKGKLSPLWTFHDSGTSGKAILPT
jgi:hypothetical protein